MSILEATVAGCTRIEQCLKELGGTGSGISELLDSVSSRVPDDLTRRLKAVAAVRNHFVHEHEYTYPGSESAFMAELESVVADLVRLTEEPSDHVIPQAAAIMSQSNEWVRVITEASTPKLFIYKWPSTAEERLVLFRGDTAEPMPLGKHKLPLFPKVRTIAYVRMSPDSVILKCSTRSRDDIPFDLTATITMKVRDNPEAIGRVALDGLQSSLTETRLVLDQVNRAVLSVISNVKYAEIPDLSTVQHNVEEQVAREARSSTAFECLRVTLTSVVSSDPHVREKQLELLKAKLRVAQYEEEQILESRIRDFKRQQDLLDLNARKEVLEAEREHERRLESDRIEFEGKRHNFAMERAKLAAETELKRETIRQQGELAKAHQIQVNEMMRLVATAGRVDATTKLLGGMLKRSQTFNVDINELLSPNDSVGSSSTPEPSTNQGSQPNPDPEPRVHEPPKDPDVSD